MGLLKKIRWATFNEWASVLGTLDSVDRRLNELPRMVRDWLPQPAPPPPPPVAVVLIRAEQKFGEEWREAWSQCHVVVAGGNSVAQFQAYRTWRNLWVLVLCDVERVRVEGMFVGTDSIAELNDSGPIGVHPGEVSSGVLVRVRLAAR